MSKPLTHAEQRALGHLREAGERGLTPTQLARLMWPDSLGWERRSSRSDGRGALGAGMPMKAGSILWRLHDKAAAWRSGLVWLAR